MTDLSMRASADTFVNQTHPDTNYSAKPIVRLNGDSGGGNQRFGLISFPIHLPTNATVIGAYLTVYVRGGWTPATAITARRITQGWRVGRVDWTTRPSSTTTGQAQLTTDPSLPDGAAVVFDVTTIVQAWVSGKANYGFRLSLDSATTNRDIYSNDFGDQSLRPSLDIEFATPPDAPTNLRPGGARGHSGSKPLLLWDGDLPTDVEVQLDDDPAFGSPLWSTGWVANAERSYDPAALTALTDNTLYYWKVRVRDANGIASAFSSVDSFYYRTLGTLAISAPAGPTVTTSKPTVTWSLTGRTQAAVDVLVYADGVLAYRRGRFATTGTSFTLPAGIITSPSVTYTIEVRAWDNLPREATGTDLDYAVDTVDVTLATGATVAPTSVVATQEGGHIHLTWESATAPDNFVITCNGALVVDDLDPADALVSGTSYAWDVWNGTPWGAQDTWGVQREVGQVLSSSATAVAYYRPVGIYVADTAAQVEVRILGKESVATTLGTTGATFYPLGRRDPIRVVDSVRGLEGSVSGDIVAWGGITAASALATLYDIRSRSDSGPPLQLVVGSWSLPVRLASLTVEQRPDNEESYGISFEFFQVDDFAVALEV